MQTSGPTPLTRLGRFEILAPIGSGGMAAIYLARIAGPGGFEKPVALKVIHSHLAEDPEFVAMFLDEARIAAQLQHSNIVQIYELGEAEGIYYIAMEYLRGETVGATVQRVVRGKRLMDPRMVCHIAMQASEGLHSAHEMTDVEGRLLGLIHRDVSPQNLFVTYTGGVKLMDFGIARAAGLSHSTRPGSLKGKFSYMSPEQVQGAQIDRRSDVFALGIVIWEMLTGRRLFKGPSDIESLRRVAEAHVPRVGELRSGIPPVLDAVVARALSRDRETRFQTALELHGDLAIAADQLGSPVTSHELAGRMASWFPDEEKRKKALLAKALPVPEMPAFLAGGRLPGEPTVESTPPSGETSGVRVREDEGSGGGGVPGTPSGTDRPRLLGPVPASLLPGVADAEVSVAVAAPRRTAFVFGTLAALVVVGAALGGGAFFLPRALSGEPEPTASDPPPAGRPPEPRQGGGRADVAAGPEPGLRAAAPAAAAAVEAPPPTVTLRLEVSPATAEVRVGGRLREGRGPLELPRSAESVQVEVSAPGYLAESFTVVPEEDLVRRVELRRRRLGGAKAPGGPREGQGSDLVSNPYAPR